ncbi:uncharacterized protein DNG_04135 [Cephalotrichum gorgonifer]|uniref:LYR motif-containing protein Cup1-like N-terminal domain-containing protein n=1 Tax=Cephalotrichum gorgonifer TaxID=2041049 RepID=A0AAE8MXV9_9PEZI|nr:uncharacterized protein DNG_04135 [Cephalotrichum gorgonifer]
MLTSRILLPRRSVRPRHLYRHLLREASYLPPICTPYISGYIKEQFRNHRWDRQHAQTRIATGLRQLRRLQAANSGSIKHLRIAFLHTFGRVGKLRRSLMAPLVLPDPPTSSDASQAGKGLSAADANVMAVYERARSGAEYKKNFLNRWDFRKLHHYVQSQVTHAGKVSPATWPRPTPNKVNPTSNLPKTNIWGYPLPPRELRTRLKHWWLTNIPKVVPPLGEGEWETLRELSTTKEIGPLLRIPPRRPVAVPVHAGEAQAGNAWNWQPYATHPVSRVERERNAGFQQSPNGFGYDPLPASVKPVSGRKLRRLAGKVFEASPYMNRSETTAKNHAVWGRLVPDYPVVSPEHSSFFANLDESGTKKKEA